jgi:ketosteroid isomerase-like protein
MKKTLFILTLILAAGIFASAQKGKRAETLEQEIRKLDLTAAEAILRKDFAALDRLCAEDFTVNSPRNEIVKGREGVKDLIRRGVVDYASFTREIETVLIYEKTAIVMGRETVVANENPGKIVPRRYTNIWTKRSGKWLLTARHANDISSNQ